MVTVSLWLFAHNGVTAGAEKMLREHDIYWSNLSDLDGLIRASGLRRLPDMDEGQAGEAGV